MFLGLSTKEWFHQIISATRLYKVKQYITCILNSNDKLIFLHVLIVKPKKFVVKVEIHALLFN